MKRSGWISIGNVVASALLSTVGSALVLSFNFGGLTEKVNGLTEKANWLTERVNWLTEKVNSIDVRLDETRSDVAGMKIDVAEIKVKVDILWRHHSGGPSSQKKMGKAAINATRNEEILQFTERHYNDILTGVKAHEPLDAIQTEDVLVSVVGLYKTNYDSSSLRLRQFALFKGRDIDSLLFTAAMSIKDRVLTDMGFKP